MRSNFVGMLLIVAITLVGCKEDKSASTPLSTVTPNPDGSTKNPALAPFISIPNSTGSNDNSNPALAAIAASPKVISALFNGSTLNLKGRNLDQIKSLNIQSSAGLTPVKITSSSATQLAASPMAPLNLLAGVIYNLVISQAHADDQSVPITVSVTLSNLTCAAGSALTFAGYTALSDAGIGGLKGGNASCSAAYPGSHWASSDEVMKLGSQYPWTKPIWIRDINSDQGGGANGGSYSHGMYLCQGFTAATSVGTCLTNSEILQMSNQTGAPSLSADGTLGYSCCNAQRSLACVK